ncbi:MAG: hypothetical protein CM15mP55_0380 [Hyphomicrobiales bacterium]|nr:MAG: hypothetical protein CM15mP55_0380 [Hyphomicrobiales bacterium]
MRTPHASLCKTLTFRFGERLYRTAEAVHARGALLVVVVTEAVSLGVLKTPGTMGADIVVGEGQSLGNGLNFGGPYVGLFAAREKFLRQMPGRLCGETVDADGKRGFVLPAVDARTTYSPRQGDIEYLHQFGLVFAGVHGAFIASGRQRFAAFGAAQS